ncbi:hypothetical protein [Ruegeria arenilitoris]|uniref:hypothetical protein n=1 Tax=Ruegeria arenilitoris TaxID=1173585 RepID=UPI003C7AB9D3
MRLDWRILVGFVFAVASMAAPRVSNACSVCTTLPEYSLADRILSARVIVLAAPSPTNPFKYASVSVLKGAPAQLETLPDIPFLVDSVTRSAFRVDPERVVLMIYGSGSVDKSGRSFASAWSKGFLMTQERAAFLEAVRFQGKHWIVGKTANPARVTFFSQYLTHEDRLLRNAALAEVHRAPYPTARQVRDVVTTASLLQELRDVNRLAYAPAVIRLLGMQSDPAAQAFVRQRYQPALRAGDRNIADWALAGIEVDGADAVEAIGQALAQANWSPEDKQKLIQVLAVGGSTWPELQEQILEIYKLELERSAELAGWIALSVRTWETDELTASFKQVLAREDLDAAVLFLVQNALDISDFD